MHEFISEDDLHTFDGWLKYQAVDAATAKPEELDMWRRLFDEVLERSTRTPKVGLMKLAPVPGEHRYAVVVRDGSNLWSTLWLRRSRKGEFFVMVPRADRDWNPHTSYHLDGTFHGKSHGKKIGVPQKRQPLAGMFRGSEHLGAYGGHGPKGVGALCDPAVFSGVVELESGILGPRDGTVVIDLVEPGHEPISWPFKQLARHQVFRHIVPWVLIRIGS